MQQADDSEDAKEAEECGREVCLYLAVKCSWIVHPVRVNVFEIALAIGAPCS